MSSIQALTQTTCLCFLFRSSCHTMLHGKPVALNWILITGGLEVQTRPCLSDSSPWFVHLSTLGTGLCHFQWFLLFSGYFWSHSHKSKLSLFDFYLTLTSQLSSSIPKKRKGRLLFHSFHIISLASWLQLPLLKTEVPSGNNPLM